MQTGSRRHLYLDHRNTYLLDGFVFLEDGGSLTIQPGVIIKGKETPHLMIWLLH